MSSALLGLGFSVITPSQASKLVLLKLVDACDDDGTNIFPAVKTIARKAQCSERQVQRELRRFQKVGLLILVERGGSGPGDTNKYRLDVQVMARIAAEGWPSEDEEARGEAIGTGDETAGPEPDESAEKGDTVSPMPKGDTEAAKGDSGDDKGDRACHPTPPINPSIDPEREGARAREEAETGIGLTVDAAWSALRPWPTYAGANEDLVRNALSSLTGVDRKTLVDCMPAFLAFHRETQGAKAKLPHLHLYVRQRNHWDALPATKSAAPQGEFHFVGSFDRPWWWLFFDAVTRLGPALLDRRSSESVWLADMVSRAVKRLGWKVSSAKLPEIEAAAMRLVQIPAEGAEFSAWWKALRGQGVTLPRPDAAQWIWVPSQWPPEDERAGLADEAARWMGAER